MSSNKGKFLNVNFVKRTIKPDPTISDIIASDNTSIRSEIISKAEIELSEKGTASFFEALGDKNIATSAVSESSSKYSNSSSSTPERNNDNNAIADVAVYID